MSKFRIIIAASLFCVGALLIPSLFALTKAQKAAADACDRALSKCWQFCDGTKDSTTWTKCNQNCEAKWEKCLKDNGAWVGQVAPTRPGRVRPPDAAPQGQKVEGTPVPTPREKATAGQLLQSNPTPTPSPKKKDNKQKQGT